MRALLFAFAAAVALVTVAGAAQDAPVVSVRSVDGVYIVDARFEIAAPPETVREVLTDYAGIPRFMPDVRKSIVRERDGARVLVEQEATSKMLLFSKTIHLLLEVHEGADVLTFRDTCGKSFSQYTGAWTLAAGGTGTSVTYTLTAKPAFSVPPFMIKRLLDSNARDTIDALRAESAVRDAR
ncbi:MAG: SRPBCC family protein [Acidobacteriota bacterium]|nr:SRPBCC family protein [Acidobacteriota bacterium]